MTPRWLGSKTTRSARVPEGVLGPALAEGRRHYVLGAFEIRALRVGLVTYQVRNHGLDPQVDPPRPRSPGGGKSVRARSVNHVDMGTGELGERRQVVNPLGLDRRRTRRLMPFGPSLALGQQTALELRNHLRVLTMSGDDDAQPPGQLQRP